MFPFILKMQDVCVRLLTLISMPDLNLYNLAFLWYLINFICMYELTIQHPLFLKKIKIETIKIIKDQIKMLKDNFCASAV